LNDTEVNTGLVVEDVNVRAELRGGPSWLGCVEMGMGGIAWRLL
jgi:hypothetical protein